MFVVKGKQETGSRKREAGKNRERGLGVRGQGKTGNRKNR